MGYFSGSSHVFVIYYIPESSGIGMKEYTLSIIHSTPVREDWSGDARRVKHRIEMAITRYTGIVIIGTRL